MLFSLLHNHKLSNSVASWCSAIVSSSKKKNTCFGGLWHADEKTPPSNIISYGEQQQLSTAMIIN